VRLPTACAASLARQVRSCHHGPVGCGDAAILLAAYSNFLRVHAKLTPRSVNSDADRMGERRNTMEELVDKIGRDGGKSWPDREIVEGV
jgi:hypothetical protein